MAGDLTKISPTPVSNCKESKGNNRPCDEKGFEADVHQKDSKPGPEKIGSGNNPPGHGQSMGSGVQTGGPQEISEKNQDQTAVNPSSGKALGQKSIVKFVSAFGSVISLNEFYNNEVRAADSTGAQHNLGGAGLANQMVAAGIDPSEEGQEEHGSKSMQSQDLASAAQEAHIEAALGESLAEKVPNPRGWALVAKGVQQAQNAQNADNQGNACRQNCEAAFNGMKTALINVANEEAAAPCSSNAADKTEANVIWMVQQMYKKCYVPMAVLFLLPGAVLTQVKSLVSFSILGTQDEDTQSPFMGIFRSMMAIFLIPATQLTVSYCIDIGNAMTDPVAQRVQVGTLMNWVNEQAFATDPKNNLGYIPNEVANDGKLAGKKASEAVQEKQNNNTVTIQNMFNTINSMLSQGLEVLNGFQLVMMCYLFLLGPIAAALYAWPAGIGSGLFKKTFASWLDGVIVLSLWKFWWCIVLLCMVVRLQEGNIDPTSQYEMYYFTAFMGILVMVPFQPFEFRPGEIVSHVLEKAQQQGGGGGGAGKSPGSNNGTPSSPGSTGSSDAGSAHQTTSTAGGASASTESGVAVAQQGDGATTSRSENSSKSGKSESETASMDAGAVNWAGPDINMPPPPLA
ncbi:MAG: hypothetical protein K2X27_20575 [Candidatus Obscuribacterales bacterium]|nr:hypothetical protein [Candidatus Obscuribacterales bacterium]